MLFQPFYKYGSCYTGHIATFTPKLDPTKGLSLHVNRDSSSEQYRF